MEGKSPKLQAAKSLRSRSGGLPLPIQLSLLQDIEDEGGYTEDRLPKFNLSRICREKPHLYSTDPGRSRQVINKVQRVSENSIRCVLVTIHF